MPTKTLIVHGWSDCSESFKRLKTFLIENNLGTDESILFVDYESREDNITFDDIIDGFNSRLHEKGLIANDTNLNVILHSTGSLVIRHWISRYYNEKTIKDCPIKKILMIAPANYGSHLAHQGKSFLGSLFKGRYNISDFLEVGQKVLDGLELASSYQWNLSNKDLFINKPYFTPDKIQTAILVGVNDYTGVKGWVNKPGTDGTVIISGTNLNSVKITLDFSSEKDNMVFYTDICKVETAFGVLENLNHSTINEHINPEKSENKNEQLRKLIVDFLKINNKNSFNKYKNELEKITNNTYKNNNNREYQQFIIRGIDDQFNPILDYRVEFSIVKSSEVDWKKNIVKKDSSGKSLSEQYDSNWGDRVNKIISSEFYKNSNNSTYRRFLVDIPSLNDILRSAETSLGEHVAITMKIYVPKIDNNITYDNESIKELIVYSTDTNKLQKLKFFYPNTTTLIELKVNRKISDTNVSIQNEPKSH